MLTELTERRPAVWMALVATAVVIVAGVAWWWGRAPAGSRDRVTAPQGALNCVAFSPDSAGKYLAVGAASGRVSLWETATRRPLEIDLPMRKPATCVAFTPDGWLVAGGVEQYVLAWQIRTRDSKLLPAFPAAVTSLQSRPRNEELVVGLRDGEICFVDTKQAQIATFDSTHKGAVKCLAFNPTGTRLLTGGADGKIVCWNAAKRTLLRQIEAHANEISSLAFDTDGDRFCSGSWDGAVKVWSLAKDDVQAEVSQPDSVSGAAFANGLLVSGCWDGKLRFWAAEEKRLVREFDTGEPIHALAVNPAGTDVATVGRSRWVQFWKTPVP